MKRIIIVIGLLIAASSTQAQFPTTDSLVKFINKYIRNSAVEAFQNLRLNSAMIGMTRFIDSAYNGQVKSFAAINDSTVRLITLGNDTFNVVIPGSGGITSVAHDLTLSGDGSPGDPLKVDTSEIATPNWVQEYIDGLTDTLGVTQLGSGEQVIYTNAEGDTLFGKQITGSWGVDVTTGTDSTINVKGDSADIKQITQFPDLKTVNDRTKRFFIHPDSLALNGVFQVYELGSDMSSANSRGLQLSNGTNTPSISTMANGTAVMQGIFLRKVRDGSPITLATIDSVGRWLLPTGTPGGNNAAPTYNTMSSGQRWAFGGANSTTVPWGFGFEANNMWFAAAQNDISNGIKFYGGTAETMRISGTGQVRIGTTDNADSVNKRRLYINGSFAAKIDSTQLVTSMTGRYIVIQDTTGANKGKFMRILPLNLGFSLADFSNATGILNVANGGSGAGTLTGYIKGNGTSPFTASATIPFSDISSPSYELLFSDTSTTVVGNTTTEATLLGNGIGTKDYSNITAGSKLVISGSGTIKTAASPGMPTITFTIGTAALGMNLAGLASSLTADAYEYEFEIVPKSVGTNQPYLMRGKITVNNGGATKTYISSSVFATAFTTTGTPTANVTGDWDTADPDNIITSHINTIEIFRK